MEGMLEGIDIKDKSGEVALRILVVQTAGNRMVAVHDRPFLRKVCKNYEEFRVGGRSAVNCVTCGSAACSWTVYVLGKTEFTMLSLHNDSREGVRPEDRKFPLRKIIDSFSWDTKYD